MNDFVYITDNAYSSGELRQMELDILHTLNFNLGRPLALHFLRRNSKAGEVDSVQHALAKYFMEVTLQVHSFNSFNSSVYGLLASSKFGFFGKICFCQMGWSHDMCPTASTQH